MGQSHVPTPAGIGCSLDFPETVSLKNSLNFSLLSVSQLPPADHTKEKENAACVKCSQMTTRVER